MLNKILLILLTINCSLPTAEAQWVQVSNGLPSSVWSLAANANTIFAGIEDYGVYKSTDNGTNWTLTLNVGDLVLGLAVNGNNVFAGTGYSDKKGRYGNVYLSTNNGMNWTTTSYNPSNGPVHSLAVNGNNVFAGTRDSGVYKSTNNGTTWTQTSLNNQWVHSLAVNGNNVFAGTVYGGVYKSKNNGTNWTQTSLNNQWVFSLAVNGNNVFAGTDTAGVFVSNDNGASWTQRNEGLGNYSVASLCIFNNYIFAGTGASVYRRPLSELTGIQPISEQIPAHYALEQNYPNPFNPTTRIRFDLPSSPLNERGVGGFVSLKIYDILGREVSTLVNEQLKPGTYEIQWNASNYPSGIYFYTLSTQEFSETRKAALIK